MFEIITPLYSDVSILFMIISDYSFFTHAFHLKCSFTRSKLISANQKKTSSLSEPFPFVFSPHLLFSVVFLIFWHLFFLGISLPLVLREPSCFVWRCSYQQPEENKCITVSAIRLGDSTKRYFSGRMFTLKYDCSLTVAPRSHGLTKRKCFDEIKKATGIFELKWKGLNLRFIWANEFDSCCWVCCSADSQILISALMLLAAATLYTLCCSFKNSWLLTVPFGSFLMEKLFVFE